VGVARSAELAGFDRLPPEAKREVEDFVSFLSLRYAGTRRSATKRVGKTVSRRFVGMWRDREDLQDSTGWVRRTRIHA